MGGWLYTTDAQFPHVLKGKGVPPDDAGIPNQSAITPDWEVMTGLDHTGANVVTLTPDHVWYRYQSGNLTVETRETTGTPNNFPFVRYARFPVPLTANRTRFSAHLVKVASTGTVQFVVSNNQHTGNWLAALGSTYSGGAIILNLLDSRVEFWWDGQVVTTPRPFVQQGLDNVRCGIELTHDTAYGYYYYLSVGESHTIQEINTSLLKPVGSLPRRNPSLTYYGGAALGFIPESISDMWIEYGGPGDDALPCPKTFVNPVWRMPNN